MPTWRLLGLILGLLVILIACGWWWNRPPAIEGTPPMIQEPQDGAIYPPGLPAPTWTWQGGNGPWTVQVVARGVVASTATSTVMHWRPDTALWARLNQPGVGPAIVTVADAAGQRHSAKFTTSPDPVTGSLFYREVILPFSEAVRDPTQLAWRFGPATAAEPPPVVLTGLPVCGNCHSFSNSGKVMGMDVDYANDKGSYALAPVERELALTRERILTWSDYRRDDGRLTFGLLPRVSPDGRFVLATVKDRSVFVPMDDLAYSQRFFPVQGILAFYDREQKTFASLPGADDPAIVQSNAVWSPDQRWVYFCRTRAVELTNLAHPESAMLTSEEADRFFRDHPGYGYQIWRLPWNDGRGGTAEPVAGAMVPGRSCFFPRISPDGRWLVYCQARQHMLLQPDAELWIVPAEGGTPRRMRANAQGMNSWHSFSPDGRWLVFASKAQGPFTQLRLAHLDAEGQDAPSVPLERLVAPQRAANIPEFTILAPTAIASIREAFMDATSHLRAGTDRFNAGDLDAAERHFRSGLTLDPRESRLHFCLGNLAAGAGRMDAAIASFTEAARLEPQRATYHLYLARALAEVGRATEARTAATRARDLATAAGDQATAAQAVALLNP